MNAEELWETTMDPKRRILKQVNIEEASEADKIFDILMGTREPYAGTERERNDLAKRARKAAAATAAAAATIAPQPARS